MQTPKAPLPERGFIEYLLILGTWKRFIFFNVIAITVLAAAVSLVLPKTYRSSATIMPPKNSNLLNLMNMSSSALMRQFSPLRALSGGLTPDLYGYVSFLKSNALLNLTVQRMDLKRRYNTEEGWAAVNALKGNMDYVVNEEGTITISAEDKEAEFAYKLVSFLVSTIDSLQRSMAVREAAENREYIGQRLDQNRADLRLAETLMKEYQEKHGVIALPSEASTAVSAYADVFAQKMLKEYEVRYLERALGVDNPQLQTSRAQLQELTQQLSQVPGQGIEIIRLYREFMVQQKLFEVLLPMYEQAKIEEQRTTSTLLLVDPPVVPERHISPKRMIITLVFFGLSLILTIVIAIFATRLKDIKAVRPEEYERLVLLAGPFKRLLRER
ncbi:MAG: hypothetical protein HY962_00760 [Ignavibacteriae bacterium]|nr:hypothetical protein [Ignavibacteriota bacterium]